MNRSRIASVLLACLLVTAGVAGSMSQPAAAASGDTCSGLDAVIYDVMTWQNIAEDPDNPCSTQYQIDQTIQDMESSDANQTHVDVLSGANAVKQGETNWGTVHDNYINDTQSVAWMKMQVAVAEAYENGSTKIQARQAGIEAINDYYATKQENLIAQFNTSASEVARLRAIAENESEMTADNVIYPDDNGASSEGGMTGGYAVDTETRNTTLVNGETQEGIGVNLHFSISTTSYDWGMFAFGQRERDGNFEQAGSVTSAGWDAPHSTHVRVAPPDSNYDEVEMMMFTDYWSRWNKIETMNNNLEPEVENFVNATYDDFDSGTINSSDVISANTAMFEYGTVDNTTDGNLYRSTGALAMMGFDTPTLNGTGTMTVTYDNQQYEGMLMAHNAPNGSWTANTTYNTSNITGPVFFATTTGEKVDFADGAEFRINEIRNEDGTSADSVSTTKYAYKTANTSDFTAMTAELQALREEIESREPSDGGGGGSGGFGGNTMLIVLGALAAGAIALGSQNGGGRRGRGRR